MFDLELSLQWTIDIQPGMTVISSWLQQSGHAIP
jgi:hypothetical protein